MEPTFIQKDMSWQASVQPLQIKNYSSTYVASGQAGIA